MLFFWKTISARIRYSWRWGAAHLIISGLLVGLVATLIYLDWYPMPWARMLNVTKIVWVLAFVDLLCGPFLTLVLVSPKKQKKTLIIDLALVGLIQFASLVYGVWVIYSARPVAVVFEVDRLVLITANQLPVNFSTSNFKPDNIARLADLPVFDIRKPANQKEYLDSLNLSLQGLPTSLRPGWWQSFDERSKSELVAKLKPLDKLGVKDEQHRREISKIVKKQPVKSEFFYIPLVSEKNLDWIAITRSDGEIVDYAPVDGF